MPPTPIPVGFGIFTAKYLRSGASTPDVTTFACANDPAQNVQQDCDDISADWLSSFTAAKTLTVYTYIGGHYLRMVTGGLEAADHVQSTTGTVAAQATSPAVACRITKKTQAAGRKFRGRLFLPAAFTSESNVDANGLIDSATITSLQASADALLTALDASNHTMMLLHRDSSTPNPVTHLVVRSSVGTQRRRQPLV